MSARASWYAVVEVPQFPLQAVLRHAPEWLGRPVALVDPLAATPRVIEATAAARAEGVTDGLTAPQALARCRTVTVRHRSLADERVATDALLQCAYGFSPNLECTANGLVTLDLRGLTILGGTEANGDDDRFDAWATRLMEALAALGLRVRVGVGPTPNVARLAARWGAAGGTANRGTGVREAARGVIRVEDPAAFVTGLPVAALEPSSDVAGILARWGIRTVGELQALGQAELAERLGLEALGLFAAASVVATRPLRLAQPAERFEERHAFEVEIESLEPLLFILRRFVDALTRRLDACGLAAGAMDLRLRLETGERLEWRLRLPQPTRRADVLFRVLHTHLESVRTLSPVTEVELVAEPARVEQRQFSLFEAALRDPHQFQETLARLAALVGADRVGSPDREDGHRPDMFSMVPPQFEGRPVVSERETPPLLRRVPIRRLRPSVPARVEVGPVRGAGKSGGGQGRGEPGSGAPIQVTCEVAGGRVQVSIGPWKSSGHWWDERRWSREEWEVALHTGRVARLVREGETWCCEGLLD